MTKFRFTTINTNWKKRKKPIVEIVEGKDERDAIKNWDKKHKKIIPGRVTKIERIIKENKQ